MYSIELSVNAMKGSNIGLDKFIKDTASEYNCLSITSFDDIICDKNRKYYINMTYIISFSKHECSKFLSFIDVIKYEKGFYIDCVYSMMSNKCKILNASKYYCKNNLNKQNRKSYLENEIFTEDENKILDALCIKK